MTTPSKYPRTFHLPDSPGLQKDDRRIRDLSILENSEVIITEKMDGENTTLYRDYIHARSLGYSAHPSRSWMRGVHAQIKHLIPEGYRICGENLYAKHSIHYQELPALFMAFSAWNGETCLAWDESVALLQTVGIQHVPVLARGLLKDLAMPELDWEQHEGYVVRSADSFQRADFEYNVAKWVRPNHVQTSGHWFHQAVIRNTRLSSG
jgi:hypothetical protein